MASEAVLKELFQVAKASKQFAGMSDSDIWNACLAYKDRSDNDIRKAMENIRNKDKEEQDESAEQQAKFEEGKQKMRELHEQERMDHQQDEKNAENILAELFDEK